MPNPIHLIIILFLKTVNQIGTNELPGSEPGAPEKEVTHFA